MKSGFLLIDKDVSLTSNDVDYKVKRIFNTKKVGHLGTLDPFATGLLIIGINEATKLFKVIDEEKKTYVAKLVLNKETDTLDNTGKIINIVDRKEIAEEEILDVFNSMLGKNKQIPPKYSAVHVNGKRAYELARNNVDFKLLEKEIYIYDIKLLDYKNDEITFKTTVSKGCYIRQLGLDIAKKLNTVGYLNYLRREEIGKYKVSDAKKINDVDFSSLIKIEDMFKDIKRIDVQNDKLLKLIKNGNVLKLDYKEETIFFKHDGALIALYKKQDDIYHLVSLLRD